MKKIFKVISFVIVLFCNTGFAEEFVVEGLTHDAGSVWTLSSGGEVHDIANTDGTTGTDILVGFAGDACVPSCTSGGFDALVYGSRVGMLQSEAAGDVSGVQVTNEGVGVLEQELQIHIGFKDQDVTLGTSGTVQFVGQVGAVSAGDDVDNFVAHQGSGYIDSSVTSNAGLCDTLGCGNGSLTASYGAWDTGTSSAHALGNTPDQTVATHAESNSGARIIFSMSGIDGN